MNLWTPPTASERKAILDRTKIVAVVGASSNPARASNFVVTYLLSSSTNFDVYLVNPYETEILDMPSYASLGDLPVVPDIVNVFRRHDDLPAIAQESIDIGAKAFWTQLGLHNENATQIAYGAGLNAVSDRCIKIEHARFYGGLRLAGFDTGLVSSRPARSRTDRNR